MNRNQSTVLIIGGVLLVIVVLLVSGFLLIWGFRGTGFPMMGPGMMGGFGAMFLVPLLVIVILGVVIWVAVGATQKTGAGSDGSDYKTETPLDILKRRYARGEIDKEEYETKKKDLI